VTTPSCLPRLTRGEKCSKIPSVQIPVYLYCTRTCEMGSPFRRANLIYRLLHSFSLRGRGSNFGVFSPPLSLPPMRPIWLLNSLQKRYFSTQEFTRCLSTVSSQRRVTHSDVSFQTKQSVCSITVELTPHTHLSLSKTLFYPSCLLPTVKVTPSDSNCFKKKRFS